MPQKARREAKKIAAKERVSISAAEFGMTSQPPIEFTPEKLADLHKAYDRAVANNTVDFGFQGRTMLTAYAKYLLEYLDNYFARQEKKP